MKQKKKKAFTIVELVIVIAVIAILAAVLIPTFSNIIDKANDSSALQNGRNMYMEYISTEDNYSKANENFVIEVKENEAYVTFKDGKIVDEVFSTKEAAINSLGAGASYIVVNEELLGTEEEHTHTEEVLPGRDATCEEAGLTEGKKCSVCGETLVAQTEIPAKGHSYTDGKCTVCQEDDPGHVHTEEVIPGRDATCTEKGLTEGKKCSVCNKVLVAQEEVAALGHTEEVLAAVPAKCTATGLTEGKKCSVCNEVLVAQTEVAALGHSEEVIPGKDATCTATGLTEGKKCSVCNEVLVAQVEIPSGHNYVDGKCNVCNELKPSEGLEYTLNADGISYSVSKGTCEDINIIIPSTYNNLPVTSIGQSAFSSCENLTSIVIPSSVTSIGQWAFTWTKFSTITIPNSITEIGYGAFQNSAVTEIIFETGSQLKSIGGCGFYSCANLTSIVIPNSVEIIGNWAFQNCTSLESIVIPSSVTSIGQEAFKNCRSLESIVIPSSVTEIGSSAFQNCTSLTIYCEAVSSGWHNDWNPDNRPVENN